VYPTKQTTALAIATSRRWSIIFPRMYIESGDRFLTFPAARITGTDVEAHQIVNEFAS
jgi:hypothetical protein